MPPPQYSADFSSIVGNAVSDTDGFEETFSVAAGHLTDAPNFLTGLDDVGSGLAGAGDPAHIPFEQEFSDSLSGTIQQGQGDFDAFGVHLLGNNPPAPGTPPGGGSGGGGGQKSGCGQHGTSVVDPTVKVDPEAGFVYLPVASVADGPCTMSLSVAPTGAGERKIASWTLLQGDSKLFTLGTHKSAPSAGTVIWYYDVTVNPTTPGKYWMEAQLVLANPPYTLLLYYWLDVIP